MDKIRIASQNKEIAKSEYETTVEKNTLKIHFKENLKEKQGYTIIIPAMILMGKDGQQKNNYNTIRSYLVRKEQTK